MFSPHFEGAGSISGLILYQLLRFGHAYSVKAWRLPPKPARMQPQRGMSELQIPVQTTTATGGPFSDGELAPAMHTYLSLLTFLFCNVCACVRVRVRARVCLGGRG